MNSGTEPLKNCTSGPDDSCQFHRAAHEYNGRCYCIYHAPLEASFKCTFAQLQMIIQDSASAATIDLSGAVFPETPGSHEYRFIRDTIARRCTFAPGVRIRIDDSADISDSTCLGDLDISWVNSIIIARGVRSIGNISVAGCQNAGQVDFTGSEVLGHFRIVQLTAKVELRLDDMTLACAPAIAVSISPAAMPQNSSIRRLKLLKTAYGDGAEGRYREIRNLFHASRDREQEGVFYRYEKRAQRKGLSLRRFGSWIPRSVSACYDWLAGYGQSFERALVWLIGLQIGFGFLYAVMSHRFAWGGTFDSQVAAFTLAQVVKPFDLLSTRTPAGWPYLGVYCGGSGVWTFVTLVHSLLSLTLAALFLLALRWRFRRD